MDEPIYFSDISTTTPHFPAPAWKRQPIILAAYVEFDSTIVPR